MALAAVPAAALILFAFALGNFGAAAGAVETALVHATLLAAALGAAPALTGAGLGGRLDPLRLGVRGRWLPAALWVAAAASCWASPVARAGLPAVLLLPAWGLVPAAVALLWRRPRARRWAPRGVALAVAAVAAWSLLGRFALGDARAASPLGHHNLQAVWLLALLPLALLPWREGGAWRLLGAAAAGLGLAALAATGSLSAVAGAAAATACALLAALAAGRRRAARLGAVAAVVAGVLVLAAAAPRLSALFSGTDPSVAARRTYAAAALAAAAERPVLGWGPGSVAWTVGGWLRPVPGVNPPGEVVGDLHSEPLQLLYEVGGTGLLLALAVLVLFAWRRLEALPGAGDRGLTVAGLLGLAASAVACLAVAPFQVPAVGLAVATAAGAALAGEGAFGGAFEGGGRHRHRAAAWAGLAYALVVAAALLPLDLAHLHYDRARGADARAASRAGAEMAAAVRLDPTFPLYRAHLARLEAAEAGGDSAAGEGAADGGAADRERASAAAADALEAAEAAPGVAALWLSAGDLALAAGEPWAPLALEQACRLDPLSAAAPYLLAVSDPSAPGAVDAAARALLAEPRLAAATFFAGHEALLADAVATAASWPGVAAGWRQALQLAAGDLGAATDGGVVELRFASDRSPRTALSLFAFRRRPRPLDLAAVPLRRDLVRRLDLPPATTLPTTAADALGERGCTVSP